VAPPEQLGSAVAELKSQTALFGNVQVVEQGQSSNNYFFRRLEEDAYRRAAPATALPAERVTHSAADEPAAGTAGEKNAAAAPRAAGFPKAPRAAPKPA